MESFPRVLKHAILGAKPLAIVTSIYELGRFVEAFAFQGFVERVYDFLEMVDMIYVIVDLSVGSAAYLTGRWMLTLISLNLLRDGRSQRDLVVILAFRVHAEAPRNVFQPPLLYKIQFQMLRCHTIGLNREIRHSHDLVGIAWMASKKFEKEVVLRGTLGLDRVRDADLSQKRAHMIFQSFLRCECATSAIDRSAGGHTDLVVSACVSLDKGCIVSF